jgi:hypothetical protein
MNFATIKIYSCFTNSLNFIFTIFPSGQVSYCYLFVPSFLLSFPIHLFGFLRLDEWTSESVILSMVWCLELDTNIRWAEKSLAFIEWITSLYLFIQLYFDIAFFCLWFIVLNLCNKSALPYFLHIYVTMNQMDMTGKQ